MNKLLKSTLCIASTVAVLATSLISGMPTSTTVSADTSAFPSSVQNEITELQAIRTKALQEYNYYAKRKCNYKGAISSDYRILFVETKNVKTNKGNTAKTTTEDNQLFAQIPGQFEMVVEYLSDYNVNIITDTLIIDEQVTATSDYVQWENVDALIADYAPYASYDSVIVFSAEHNDFGCPNTSIGARDAVRGYSYSWVPIALWDHKSYNPDPNHHLYSVDVAIHEWLHTLESFRDISDTTVLMPSADIPNTITQKSDANGNYYTNGNYRWDNTWPTDTVYGKSTEFYKGREPDRIAYARAFLCGKLYDYNNLRYVGMFPAFWRFFDTKVFLGEFYAQDASGQYAAFLGSNTAEIDRQAAPEHGNDAYVWRIFYSYSDNAVYVMSKKHQYWCYKYTSTGLKNDTFTQISFDGSDTYYIYNKGAGKYLAYDETTKTYKFSNFSTADTLQWNINYTGDNFYTISPKKAPQFRFDIANAWNSENNNVNLHVETGYDSAQTFQFRLNSDNTYSFYPMLSNTRCVKASNSKLVIATGSSSNNEKWVITKANGGKEIVAGNYTIKTVSNGKYINAGSSYNLSLSYSSTKWNIAPYSYTINADNFYLLKAANGRILDLMNTYNMEGNQIGAHPSVTGYATGQAWQFELGVDASGEYFLYIIPLNTRTRSLSVTGSTVCLSTSMSAVKLTRG